MIIHTCDGISTSKNYRRR